MKVIVAHPGKQHSFHVAKALKSAGLLYKYATTVYDKNSSILMRIVKSFLGKSDYARAQGRKCSALDDDDIVQFCELEGILLLALIRIDKRGVLSKAYNGYISRKFQRKLAKYIIRENIDIVISYDTNSDVLFGILKEKAPHVIRIMDNAAPNRHYLYKKYHEFWDTCGDFDKTLDVYHYITNETVSKKYIKEVLLAQYHIVASSFSLDSIVFEGVNTNSVFVIPYGVDKKFFVESERKFFEGSIHVLFLGKVNQQKGIAQVLQAAQAINNKDVQFDIVGPGIEYDKKLYEPYKNYVNFRGYLSGDALLAYLKNSHVFVFPTMGEGFGLVLLETMAAGLVPITTHNCGGADIVKDGINGFLVEVGDTKDIIRKILWCKDHPVELSVMSQNAIETAHRFTWERYENQIVDMVLSVSEDNPIIMSEKTL